jgi:NAD(P)-dependent dehydrogenase (short-subunit alcohol dehydrogenase family)
MKAAAMRVLITGASGGIGRALARELHGRGASVLLVGRDVQALASAAQELGGRSPRVDWCAADLATGEGRARVVEAASRWGGGGINVLVNNAGLGEFGMLDELDDTAIERLFAINAIAPMQLTRALLPLMASGGSIINQSSIWGRSGVADFSAYVASKHAVIGVTRSLAWELAPRGLRVNAVCPGWIRTGAALASLQAMAQKEGRAPAEIERELLAHQAMPQWLEPSDIAGVYLFLASDDARALTGQSLVASRGEVMA